MKASRIALVATLAALLILAGALGLYAQRGFHLSGGVVKGASWYHCPAAMALVYDMADLSTAYCIDRWEDHVKGSHGSRDQFSADRVPPEGVAISEPGVMPLSATSFDMARALCANTPVVDRSGEIVGRKRLPTSSEWEDAGDGLIGPGGFTWPYGDTFDEERCISLRADGSKVWHEFQPTGSKPGCVSWFGVYDLSGNLWEWADPQLTLDIDHAFALAAEAGIKLEVGEGGYVKVGGPEDLKRLMMNIVGAPDGQTFADEEGYLQIHADQLPPMWLNGPPAYRGYLVLRLPGLGPAEGFLPVEIRRLERRADSNARLLLLKDHDGAPITDKRGGAYYTGTAKANSTHDPYLGHFHDFTGTIGFRCVCDPLVTSPF